MLTYSIFLVQNVPPRSSFAILFAIMFAPRALPFYLVDSGGQTPRLARHRGIVQTGCCNVFLFDSSTVKCVLVTTGLPLDPVALELL